ncbi:hypothetical protein BH09SUM1_BH09SUM1_14020 [soil metagenome]
MKILYLCGDHGIAAFGRKGASTHMREMIAAFRGLGHEICLAASDLSGDRRDEEDFQTVKLPTSSSRLLGHDGRYVWANRQARAPLEEAVRTFRPDAIYERSALYFGAGAWLAKKHGLPRIMEVNALLAEEQRTRLHFAGAARKFEENLLRKATAIAAISNQMCGQLKELGCDPARLRPFPMAVDPSRFHPSPRPNAHRKSLNWPADAVVLGYVGSMNSYHRPSWYVDFAEKILRRAERDVRFLIVGGTPDKIQRYRSRLLKWEEEGRVLFTGSVPQAEMVGWLSAMDAVLIPGASPQSTPTKIFETAAVGRPMLLPATEPISEICGADSIFLFKANDFRSFEDKVRDYLARPRIYDAAAEEFRNFVVEKHTWEQHARRLVEWFQRMKDEG